MHRRRLDAPPTVRTCLGENMDTTQANTTEMSAARHQNLPMNNYNVDRDSHPK